jgi:hypothetical protein
LGTSNTQARPWCAPAHRRSRFARRRTAEIKGRVEWRRDGLPRLEVDPGSPSKSDGVGRARGPHCSKSVLPPGTPGGANGPARATAQQLPHLVHRLEATDDQRSAERTGHAVGTHRLCNPRLHFLSDPGEHVTDGRRKPLAAASRRDTPVIESACDGPQRLSFKTSQI